MGGIYLAFAGGHREVVDILEIWGAIGTMRLSIYPCSRGIGLLRLTRGDLRTMMFGMWR